MVDSFIPLSDFCLYSKAIMYAAVFFYDSLTLLCIEKTLFTAKMCEN